MSDPNHGRTTARTRAASDPCQPTPDSCCRSPEANSVLAHRSSGMVAQVQAQFSFCNVVQQRTRFDYVIAALAPEVATEVRDLILNLPADQPYDRLKDALIQQTKASEQHRLQQQLTAEELGDRKPSQLLRRMQQLLGNSGPALDSAIIWQLFMQRLPPSVSMVLACLLRWQTGY